MSDFESAKRSKADVVRPLPPIAMLWAHALVERDNLNPVRAFAGRIASDRLQRTALGVDRVRGERVGLLAGHDDEAAARVDGEAARLLLGRRAAEIGELSARAVDAEGAQRARRALGRIEEAAVRREVKVCGPVVRVICVRK